MIIANKEEAFSHNSCKKIAQLIKVITVMTDQSRDMYQQINEIHLEFDNLIEKIVEDFKHNLIQTETVLTRYRKDIIDQSCKEYGSKYKKAKQEYTDLMKEKSDLINKIISDSRQMKKDINSIEIQITDSANQVATTADEFFLEVKNISSKAAIEDFVRKNPSIVSILQKTSDVMKQFELTQKELTTEHELLKRELIESDSKLSACERAKKAPLIKELKDKLLLLNHELMTLKNTYSECMNFRERFGTEYFDKVNTLIKDLSKEYFENQNKIKSLNGKIEQETSKHNSNLQSIEKTKRQTMKVHTDEINTVKTQITIQKELNQKTCDNKNLELKKLDKDGESKTQGLLARHNSEISLLSSKCNTFQNELKRNQDGFENIFKNMTNIKNSCISDLVEFSVNFNTHINDSYENVKKSYEKQKVIFRDNMECRFKELENRGKLEKDDISALMNNILSENKKLQDGIEKLKVDNQKILEETEEANIAQRDRSINDFKRIIDQKNADIERNIQYRINEAEKKLETIIENYNNDCKNKVSQIQEKNKQILEEKRYEYDLHNNFDSYVRDHASELLRAKGKLEYTVKDYNFTIEKNSKELSKLDYLISNGEKAIRQLYRSTKTDSEKIIRDHEIQLQLLQVKLNDSIENIAKLFDKEENSRGVEIIEAIRKVRRVQNIKVEQITKRMKKHREIIDDIRKRKDELSHQILMKKTGGDEKDLDEIIKQKQEQLAKIIEAEEEETQKILNIKRKEIEKEKEKIQNIKDSILSKANEENERYEKEVERILQCIEELKTVNTDPMKEIDDKIEIERVEKTKENDVLIRKTKNRIEFLSATKEDIRAALTDQEESLIQTQKDELVKKSNELQHYVYNDMKRINETVTKYETEIGKIEVNHLNHLINSFEAGPRFEEKTRKTDTARINLETSSNIEILFGTFVEFLKSPVQIKPSRRDENERPASQNAGRRSSLQKVGLASNRSRKSSIALVTPLQK